MFYLLTYLLYLESYRAYQACVNFNWNRFDGRAARQFQTTSYDRLFLSNSCAACCQSLSLSVLACILSVFVSKVRTPRERPGNASTNSGRFCFCFWTSITMEHTL